MLPCGAAILGCSPPSRTARPVYCWKISSRHSGGTKETQLVEPGQIIGDYEIVELIGSGGMGTVYRVRHLISDRAEAMKVLLPDLRNAPDLAERFIREIKIQASLTHPNIASLYT